MPPAQTTTPEPGWPTNDGPLRTLAALGIIPDANTPISWLRAPTSQHTVKGPSWKFKPLFLHREAICALAALTLEGYNVHISPDYAPDRFQVTIRPN
jgi:hypothetical protein